MPTPEDTNNQGSNKPNPNNAVQELQTTPNPTPGCAAEATGGVTEVVGRASDVRKPHSEGSSGEVQARAVDVAKPQQTTVPGLAHSLEVDCRPCKGCCGGRRGRRLPRRVVELIQAVKKELGLRYECEVVNRWPELFCRRIGRRGHGLNRVKELERLLSREGEYKASYVLDRLRECLNDAICWRYLRLGVEGWYRVVHLLADRAPSDVEAYFAGLIRGLGFSGVAEASRYLRLITQGLVDFNYVNRGRGFRDVLSVRCRICGEVIDVTGPLPSVLARLIRHFRVEHGLKAISDVEEEVKESEGVSDFDVLRRGKRYFDGLMSELVDAFSKLGWIKDGRCALCGEELKSSPYHVVLHFAGWHGEEFRRLLSGIAPQVREQPNVEEELADAAREVAQRLGIDFELADGAIKSIYYIVNIRGVRSIDAVVRELADVDPGLADRLRESGKDARQIALTVVEVLKARGLIEAKEYDTGESKVGGVDEVKARAAAMLRERLSVSYDFTELINDVVAFIEGNVDVNVDELANFEPLVEVAGRLKLDAKRLAEVILSVLVEVGVIENEGE